MTSTTHVLAEFDRCLQQERMLAPATRVHYRLFVNVRHCDDPSMLESDDTAS